MTILAREPAVLFEGGPVQPYSAICVARARQGVAGFLGFSRVVGQIVMRNAAVTIGRQAHVEADVRGVRVHVLGTVHGSIAAGMKLSGNSRLTR